MSMNKRRWMLPLLLVSLIFSGCSGNEQSAKEVKKNGNAVAIPDAAELDEKVLQSKIDKRIAEMTPEEKAAQLFIILPEALMDDVGTVTAAGKSTRSAINEIPVGGFIYMNNNLESEKQVCEMLGNVQEYSLERTGIPMFLTVDEEGGTVTRISGRGKFAVPNIGDMSEIGAQGDYEKAYGVGASMGEYLGNLGFNVDFAPDTDVLTNPDNQVVKRRSFGEDPEVVSDMAFAVRKGLEEHGVYAVYKHFPGHGMTAGDTHEGYAYSKKTLEEIETCELIPFQRGVEEKVSFIMVGHISTPEITGDNLPASMSKYMITDLLRDKMGYEGIIITDAMNMGAIVQKYSSAEAAVKSLQAGADIILMPENFKSAYKGVLKAMKDGTLSEERVDEALRRILYVKFQMQIADCQ